MGKIVNMVENEPTIVSYNIDATASENNSSVKIKSNGFVSLVPSLTNEHQSMVNKGDGDEDGGFSKSRHKSGSKSKTNKKQVSRGQTNAMASCKKTVKKLPTVKQNGAKEQKSKDDTMVVRKKRGRPSKDGSKMSSGTVPPTNSSNCSQNNNNLLYDPSKKQRDPFLLLDYQHFSDDLLPPFTVKVKLDTLALMDLHSHCVHTEVIGCLGGFYCKVTKTLHILVAEPCFSIDDRHTTCEMDPVSQVLIFQKLEQKNLTMVGWYHSHPTCLANPSLRDMETQMSFQNFFTNLRSKKPKAKSPVHPPLPISSNHQNNGGHAEQWTNEHNEQIEQEEDNPFVAFIISPFTVPGVGTPKTSLTAKSFTRYEPIVEHASGAKFYANNTVYSYRRPDKTSYCYFTHELNSVLSSSIKCFWVGDSKYSKLQLPTKQRKLLIPYQIETRMFRDENFIPSITNRLSEMCQRLFQDYSKTQSMVDLLKRYTRVGSINVTYLEKMIASLSHHLQNPSVAHLCTEYECERIRIECVSILMQELIADRPCQQLKKRRIE